MELARARKGGIFRHPPEDNPDILQIRTQLPRTRSKQVTPSYLLLLTSTVLIRIDGLLEYNVYSYMTLICYPFSLTTFVITASVHHVIP